jgi:hypothetical protein
MVYFMYQVTFYPIFHSLFDLLALIPVAHQNFSPENPVVEVVEWLSSGRFCILLAQTGRKSYLNAEFAQPRHG